MAGDGGRDGWHVGSQLFNLLAYLIENRDRDVSKDDDDVIASV